MQNEKILLSESKPIFKKICGVEPTTRSLGLWARQGVKGTKLETVRVGSRHYTSETAIQKFLRDLNE
jgi:hypothetical protein